ncbi:unnamed protein product [Cylicostephanus goldi]|uniref:Rhodanese domain-containing protein n=1 Tax=Cylicostephanus goldi TaxID=71465 RepID=A0A3P6T2X6_CYLGO|nr:unnamed protein product [Cylicostephanus goldi]
MTLPEQLTASDVPDFVQLSAYYADRTPQCVREDFHYLIFGSNYDDEAGDLQVSKLLCLPVTVQELIKKDRAAVTASKIAYFVIDCRSNDAYNCGHIYGSFSLDCQLLVDAPSQFEIALNSLESYKNAQKFDEHICFFGYGDEDQVKLPIKRFESVA